MPEYTQAELNTQVTALISKTFSAANFLIIANMAVRRVISEVDLRSMKRKTALSPNLFDDVHQYTCPASLSGNKLIDIDPQINRGRLDYWRLTTEEEFNRNKSEIRSDRYGDPIEIKHSEWLGENLVAISNDDLVRKLLISRPIDDTETKIDQLDAVGNWVAFGDGTNVTKDSDNYVKGSASLNFDINADGGTTAGIVNPSLTAFDLSAYITAGSAFVWTYITSVTNLTNFIIRIGSDSSNYYSITVTTNNEGNSFHAGWNLLRFDFSGKATTGTPVDASCDYVALYMTKDGAKVSENDYRFDNLTLRIGKHYNVIFYTKYGWQTSAGSYIENATTTTDLINVEADELNLIELKIAELIERHLKNSKEATELKKEYLEAKAIYIRENPSEAMLLVQKYFDL